VVHVIRGKLSFTQRWVPRSRPGQCARAGRGQAQPREDIGSREDIALSRSTETDIFVGRDIFGVVTSRAIRWVAVVEQSHSTAIDGADLIRSLHL
jgi:hypothetical protein